MKQSNDENGNRVLLTDPYHTYFTTSLSWIGYLGREQGRHEDKYDNDPRGVAVPTPTKWSSERFCTDIYKYGELATRLESHGRLRG